MDSIQPITNHSDEQVLQMIFEPNLPLEEKNERYIDSDQNINALFDQNVLNEVKDLELKGVRCAENNDLDNALTYFGKAITLLPDYSSAYNNRAQARRMKNDKSGAYDDLDKAITLSTGKVASLAYTQRALLYKLDGDEQSSLEDFKHAAILGCAFAKHQVVEANPYAALCNKMLTDVIGKLRAGDTQG